MDGLGCHRGCAPIDRRQALFAGACGIAGLGLPQLFALNAAESSQKVLPRKSVLFVFLTGGISHQDSFDLKPEAPSAVRGEFDPIATAVPGIEICEHLPLLAARAARYALVRSAATNSDGHEEACHMLLTGRLDFPAGFNVNNVPSPNEWPSLPAQVTYATRGRNQLPPAVVLPQPSVNEAGRVRPGQYAGRLGPRHEAWHLEVAAPCALGNGACPHCFRFEGTPFEHGSQSILEVPMLTLPEGGNWRFRGRLGLLEQIDVQRRQLELSAELARLDRHRQQAVSLLASPQVRAAFDVESADAATVARYGKNKFGLSLLMGFRLVAAGVNLVQVNLGKNSTWDTHRRNFANLRDNLLPYLDRALAALLDDLESSGHLETTLLVVTGEFGRTPKINADAGRDHWSRAMTMLLAGGGTTGGMVLGATDKLAAQPVAERQTPENLAASMYQALGLPRSLEWVDLDGRPHALYRAEPMPLG
jgi:hypothetical protein